MKSACGAAGIVYGRKTEGGFTFHDLRHGFVTYARKAGVPRNVILAITGHSGGRSDMNRRYDRIDESDLLEAVDRIEGFLAASIDQSIDQSDLNI